MSTRNEDLILIYFVRQHPELWQHTSGPKVRFAVWKDRLDAEEKWAEIDRQINGDHSEERVKHLQSQFRKLVSDYRDYISDYTRFLLFLDDKPCVEIRPYDFDLSVYGLTLADLQPMCEENGFNAITAVARLIKLFDRKNKGNNKEVVKDMHFDRFGRRRQERTRGNEEQHQDRQEVREGFRNRFETAADRRRFNHDSELDTFSPPKDTSMSHHRRIWNTNSHRGKNTNRFGFLTRFPEDRGFDRQTNRPGETRNRFADADYSTGRKEREFAKNSEPFSSRYGTAFEDRDYGDAFGENSDRLRYVEGYGRADYLAEQSNVSNCGSDRVRDLSDVEEDPFWNGGYDCGAAPYQIEQAEKMRKEAKKQEKTNEEPKKKTEKCSPKTVQGNTENNQAVSVLDDPRNYEHFYTAFPQVQIHPIAKQAKEREAAELAEKMRNTLRNRDARGPNSEEDILPRHTTSTQRVQIITNNPGTGFKAHTEFGDFDVESEDLADAITWLNEPANERTIALAEKQIFCNRTNDIGRLIQKKLELQKKYLASWTKKNIAPRTLAEIEFLKKKGVKSGSAMSVFLRKTPSLPKPNEASTLYGQIKTTTIGQAAAITFLNSDENINIIIEAEKKMWRGEKLSYEEKSFNEKLQIQDDFIRQWKIDNLGKPIAKLPMSEMTWIVSKEEHFDEIHQKRQAEQLQAGQKKHRLVDGASCLDSRHYGTVWIPNPEVALALNWIDENPELCNEVKHRLALGSRGALDLAVKDFLDLQKQFLEQYRKENLVKKNPDFNLFRYCNSEEDKLKNDKYIGDKYKSLPGALTDPIERNIAVAILRMEKSKRSRWAGHWAIVSDCINIRTRDTKIAAAIMWLNEIENNPTIAEVRRKQAAGLKLGDIDQAILKKIELERTFVKEWRTVDFVDRTDFELTVLVPGEFAYIQKKEAEYQNAGNNKTQQSENNVTTAAITGPETQDKDLLLGFEDMNSPSASSNALNIPNTKSQSVKATVSTDLDPIQADLERLAERSTENGFEPTELSPTTSSFELVTGTGTRTEQLTRMLADLLANLEFSNPEEYQIKEQEILKLLGN